MDRPVARGHRGGRRRLQAGGHVRAFAARALPPTDLDGLLRDAWDLDAIAARYRGFVERWPPPAGPAGPRSPTGPPSPIGWASTWPCRPTGCRVIRQDPRLPARHLPADWPAAPAQEVFRARYADLDPNARAIAAEILDVLPDLGLDLMPSA